MSTGFFDQNQDYKKVVVQKEKKIFNLPKTGWLKKTEFVAVISNSFEFHTHSNLTACSWTQKGKKVQLRVALESTRSLWLLYMGTGPPPAWTPNCFLI